MSNITKTCDTYPFTNIFNYSIIEEYENGFEEEEELLAFYKDIYKSMTYLIDFENILREFEDRYVYMFTEKDDFALKFIIEYIIHLKLTIDSMYDEIDVDNHEALVEYCIRDIDSISYSAGVANIYIPFYKKVIDSRSVETFMFLFNRVNKVLDAYLDPRRTYIYCGYINDISNKKGSNIIMLKGF